MNIKKFISDVLGTGNTYKIKSTIGKLIPDSIRIDISASCNAKCPFCPREYMPDDRKRGFMPYEEFCHIIDSAKEYGIKRAKLYITSEPTTHPKFDEMVSYCKEKDLKVYVSTNAFTLHKHFETFKEIDFIQFSIEGWDKESYEKYRTPLKFERVYENLKKYSEIRPKKGQVTSIHLPLTRNTKLDQFFNTWGNFVDQIRIGFMQPANSYSGGIVSSNFNTELEEDYYDFEPQAKHFACFDPFSEFTVGYDGKIMMCCLDYTASQDLGHISEGLHEVYNNKNMEDIRNQFFKQKLDTCRDCSLFYHSSQAVKDDVSAKIKAFQLENTIKAEILFN